jgi:hypothetical protein
VVDWKPYLESICEKYAQWWDTYTLTNVVGNKYDKKVRKSLLLDLQAIALKPETVKPEKEQFLEAREEREIFNVLEGLRKYAPEHVLLSGRPGSGKSTALVRLLLEEAEKTSPQTPLRSGEGLKNAPPSLVGKGVGGLGQIPVLVELRYYDTSILDTASSENILDGLNWLKQQAENDPEATIFIYYSGHGCLDESGDYYLIPHESDRVDIPNTALPATKFNAALQQIPAQRLLVIIDSCHAQGMASSKEGANNRPPLPKGFTQTALPKNIIDELKQGTGRVVFTSSTGNQLSWIRPDGKMSVYTYHLLEALQGAANQAGDKAVRVSHLMNYLGKTIKESARDLCKAEQTPFFDFATEDFPVALLHGGKGLATEGWDKQKAEEKIREIYNNLAVNNSDVGNIVNVIGGNNNFGDISSSKGK